MYVACLHEMGEVWREGKMPHQTGMARGGSNAAVHSTLMTEYSLPKMTPCFILEQGNVWPEDMEAYPLWCRAACARRFSLIDRERETFAFLAKGRSVPVIAEQLGVSQNTVRFHCKNIYEKCGVHFKQELLSLMEEDAEERRG